MTAWTNYVKQYAKDKNITYQRGFLSFDYSRFCHSQDFPFSPSSLFFPTFLQEEYNKHKKNFASFKTISSNILKRSKEPSLSNTFGTVSISAIDGYCAKCIGKGRLLAPFQNITGYCFEGVFCLSVDTMVIFHDLPLRCRLL